jgi:hypothetical protein
MFGNLNTSRILKVMQDWDPEAVGWPVVGVFLRPKARVLLIVTSQDHPAPPLLIVDFEKTLVATEWHPKYGWRHVKRPGAEKFIKEAASVMTVAVDGFVVE